MYAYVGSRTSKERNARGKGISVFRFDSLWGTLELVQVVEDLINPSFLALSRDGRFLYTVHGDEHELSAFAIDHDSGTLIFLNQQSTGGKNPVHLAFDPSGRYLVVSNHIGASLAVVPVAADGRLEPLSQLVEIEGPVGPHRVEQKQTKPHFNLFDPAGRFVIVPDKGTDRTHVFRFINGKLEPAAVPFAVARDGSGPRHASFHPHAPFVYLVNELDSTVTAYRYDELSGNLDPLQVLSTLPETFTGNNRASEIEVARNGRFLFASNRGMDSIAVFEIDDSSGRLRFLEVTESQGRTPRFFALAPDNRVLFALNEDSDSIVGFNIDLLSGRLRANGFSIGCDSPVCMVFSA
jgi:6-phosphogluconolactonase